MSRNEIKAEPENKQDGAEVVEYGIFVQAADEAQSTSGLSMQNSTKSVQAAQLDLGQRVHQIFRSHNSHDSSLSMEQFLKLYAEQYNETFPIADEQIFMEYLISQKDVVVFRESYAGAMRFFLDVHSNTQPQNQRTTKRVKK